MFFSTMTQTSRLLIFVIFLLSIVQFVSSIPVDKNAAVIAITNQKLNCPNGMGCPASLAQTNAALKSQRPLAPMAVILAAGGVLVSFA